MSILVARHGETALNAARVLQHPGTPLSERGIAQADRLAARLEPLGVQRILSSDYARARMTAERIAARLGVAIEIDPMLRERNFGDVRGRPYSELPPDLFGPDYEPPGGETWAQFFARVDLAFERVARVARATPGNLAVITHGLVCAGFVERHLRRPVDAPTPRGWGNTSLTIAESEPPWPIRVLNCTAHLDADTGAQVEGRA
jgi:probable phosphoglycerate mutase